jgi:hypothetical protein
LSLHVTAEFGAVRFFESDMLVNEPGKGVDSINLVFLAQPAQVFDEKPSCHAARDAGLDKALIWIVGPFDMGQKATQKDRLNPEWVPRFAKTKVSECYFFHELLDR